MKKLELLDKNSNLIHSIVFEDNQPLYKDAEIKIKNFPKLKYQEFLDYLDDGADVLIPFNNGKEFIIQNPSQHTLEFVNSGKNKNDEITREDVIGRSYADVFQTLNELKLVKEIYNVNKTGKTKQIRMMYYENNELCASFSKVILKIDGKIYLIVKRESDFNIIYKQEHDMFYNSSQAMVVIQNQKFVRVNETYLEKTGYTKEEIIGNNFLFNNPNYLHFKNNKEILEIYIKVLNREIYNHNDIISIQKKNSEDKIYFKGNLNPVLYNNQPAVQFSGFDITNTINMQKKSERINNAMKDIEHISKLSYLYWDVKSGFNWSDEIYSILDLKKGELTNDTDLLNTCIMENEKNILKNNIDNCLKNGGSFKLISKIKTKSKIKDVIIYGEFYKKNNKVSEAIGYVQDISENIEKENKLKKVVKEKEVLLKEVHHRVKNNLQIILSLLRLDERFNPINPKETLEATKNRINSMAKIHEKIYQSSDLAHVNLKEYIESEINGLFKLYSIKHIKINFKLDNINLDMEKAIPIGLIINEIVHNTIKYAFPNNKNGNLTTILKEKENDNIELIIEDDGIGMPESFDLETSNTLGLIVIKNLIYQIEGHIEMINQKGTGFKINFKK